MRRRQGTALLVTLLGFTTVILAVYETSLAAAFAGVTLCVIGLLAIEVDA